MRLMDLGFELVADEFAQVVGEFFAIDFLDHFLEEAEYHELHRVALSNATLHHIEQLFGIDITCGSTV
jgi:hypothetical protein